MTEPHIVADVRVAPVGPLRRIGRLPTFAENRERVGRQPRRYVVATIHDERRLCCDGTILSDDQAIPDEVEVVEHVILEALRTARVVVVSVVTDDDRRPRDELLEKAKPLDAGEWKADFGRRPMASEHLGMVLH